MVSREKKISIVLVISGTLFVIGFLFIFGVWAQPEVHLLTHEFEYQESVAFLNLRFESKTGVFTVGQEIIIDAKKDKVAISGIISKKIFEQSTTMKSIIKALA